MRCMHATETRETLRVAEPHEGSDDSSRMIWAKGCAKTLSFFCNPVREVRVATVR